MNYDIKKIISEIKKFEQYVLQNENRSGGAISFHSPGGFLYNYETEYKDLCWAEGRALLQSKKWSEDIIGNGKIAEYSIKAIYNKHNNFVDQHQKTHFRNVLNEKTEEAERVLYEIFVDDFGNAQNVFEHAVDVFGGKYDLIAYLFFFRDNTIYLPMRSSNMKKSFEQLGITDYNPVGHCNWENYCQYLEIVNDIKEYLQEYLSLNGEKLTLVDAQSFLWVIHYEDYYKGWKPNKETAAIIEEAVEQSILSPAIVGEKSTRMQISVVRSRSDAVAKETKQRANGVCQLCKQKAPFLDTVGMPYLESHHVKWLSRDGEDSTDNTVALCPNCHKRMHILDNDEDVDKLYESYKWLKR